MNFKQKLGYTALGAVIMLVGLGFGAIFSPPLVAQKDGVFDTIECSTLAVLDKHGNPGIIIAANEDANAILLYDQAEREAAILYARGENRHLSLSNPDGTSAASIDSTENGNNLTLYNDTGKSAITLDVTHALGRIIGVFNEKGKAAIGLSSLIERDSNFLSVQDKAGKNVIELVSDITGANMRMYDTAGNVSWQAH